jgi:pimeloyl-ACP methyl ester carboxylesterase
MRLRLSGRGIARRRYGTPWAGTAIAAAAASLVLSSAMPATAAPSAGARVPVPLLTWQACTSPAQAGFQCATARVPLDYRYPTGATIEIAVIRHLATGPGQPAGSLFFNPGGPGGAGTSALPVFYSYFPAVLRQRFNIISFDPRGTGDSTAVQCFPSAAAEAAFLAKLPAGFPVRAAEQRLWISVAARFGQRCERHNAALLPHLATADVARDMDLLRQAVGAPSLNYLGVSYGSYLGATYANLFPGTVHAMVLDGNVAPPGWAGPGRAGRLPLSTFLRLGSDLGRAATLGQFLGLCGQAGTAQCAFSAGTPQATRAKYATLLRRLWPGPVTATIPGLGPVTITYALLVTLLGDYLYTVLPAAGLPGWAYTAALLQVVWQASGGSTGQRPAAGTITAPAPPAGTAPMTSRPATPLGPSTAPGVTTGAASSRYAGEEQQLAILCADSPNPRDPAGYPAQAAFSHARAGAIGLPLVWLTEFCATWPATDADGYYGPWDHPTASPILLVGNIYDPATPYSGSHAMAAELARARLLTVAGYGHTALLNPSTCVADYETSYFLTGALPPAGAVCQQDQQPFGLPAQP